MVDAILIDFELHEGLVLEFFFWLKNSIDMKEIPIFFLVEEEKREKIINLESFGRTEVLIKPESPEQYRKIISNLADRVCS